MKWPRKHQYRRCCEFPYGGIAQVPVYRCIGCHAIIRLDAWWLASLPWEMAQCHRGVGLGLSELLRYLLCRRSTSVNCLGLEAAVLPLLHGGEGS